MSKYILLGLVAAIVFAVPAWMSAKAKDNMETKAKEVIKEYTDKLEPIDLARRQAWYKYSTTGDKKESAKEAELNLKLRQLNSDKERFAKVKELYKNRKELKDPIVKRQIEIIYLYHLPNQISDAKLKRLTELEKIMQEGFNDFVPVIDGKKYTAVEISHILSDSKDSALLEKAWKAQHEVGKILEKDFRELVLLRNDIAHDLGYENALALAAEVSEMDLKMLDKFYADVTKASDKAFKDLKEKFIDPKLAARYNIKVADLKPWHYQNAYFQEAPTAIFGEVDLDSLYKGIDSPKVVSKTIDFYGSMGIDINGIIKNSSLYPKPGKNQHAVADFLNPNDANSPVLIMSLPNPPTPPKASEASTLVHELGHDVNYKATLSNKNLPYLLHDVPMLTEAFAMLMEEQTKTADWYKHLGADEQKAKKALESVALINYVDQLIFLRWSANIYCFEKKMYTNPNVDIGDAWWQCKGQNQLLSRPEGWKNPDALGKYHITNASVLYYSNYALGRVANVQIAELFANKIGEKLDGASYFGKKNLGEWMMKDFLAQGLQFRWDDYLKKYTGKPLSVDAWKKRYIDSGIDKKLFSTK